jgi:hypothetical protein
MAKAMREALAVRCREFPSGPEHVDGCVGIIPLAQSGFGLEIFGKENLRHSWIATIRLQWNPKPKMMLHRVLTR